MPIRKPHGKRRQKKRSRTRSPPIVEYVKPARHTVEEEEEVQETRRRSPRIYTEEREVYSHDRRMISL